METYYSFHELQNNKCSICILSFLIFIFGLIIGNNVSIQECNCFNNSILL